MWFKLTLSISGVVVDVAANLPIHMGLNHGIDLNIWMRKLHHQGNYSETLCCDAVTNRTPPSRAHNALKSVLASELYSGYPPPNIPIVEDEKFYDKEGNIIPKYINYPMHLSEMHPQLKEFQRETRRDLYGAISSFIRVWRWRANAAGSHNPLAEVGFTFSEDGIQWRPMPADYKMTIEIPARLPTAQEALDEVARIMREGFAEPFPHELIREGKDISRFKPRSALLIMSSALETGIKHYLTELSPSIGPLVEKMPSPPVLTLLQEVIPAMHRSAGIETALFPLHKENADYLRKWITQRNQVAHGVKQEIDQEQLRDFSLFISDILYALDFLRGHEWALSRLQTGRLIAS